MCLPYLQPRLFLTFSAPTYGQSSRLFNQATGSHDRGSHPSIMAPSTMARSLYDGSLYLKTAALNPCFSLSFPKVHCNSVDPSLNPVKGRISYDARQQRAEFIPHNTLYPNSQYTVILLGGLPSRSQFPFPVHSHLLSLSFHACITL